LIEEPHQKRASQHDRQHHTSKAPMTTPPTKDPQHSPLPYLWWALIVLAALCLIALIKSEMKELRQLESTTNAPAINTNH